MEDSETESQWNRMFESSPNESLNISAMYIKESLVNDNINNKMYLFQLIFSLELGLQNAICVM